MLYRGQNASSIDSTYQPWTVGRVIHGVYTHPWYPTNHLIESKSIDDTYFPCNKTRRDLDLERTIEADLTFSAEISPQDS